ncbi:MAG: cyclase family protein [Sphaerochaetaceae bacterium]
MVYTSYMMHCASEKRGSIATMIIDLTIPLKDGLKMLGTFPPVAIKDFFTFENTRDRYVPPCQGCKTTLISLIDHIGTHVDSPVHFISGGKDISQLPVDAYMGDAVFLDVSEKDHSEAITADMLRKHFAQLNLIVNPGKILLLRCTRKKWSEEGFLTVHTLSEDAAYLIVHMGFKAVGIDCMAVDSLEDLRRPAHMVLLSHEVVIIEGLNNLWEIGSSECHFIALPLKLEGASGSPVRAICIV